MSKINKNRIIKHPILSLFLLAGFTLLAVAVVPGIASAQDAGYVRPYQNPSMGPLSQPYYPESVPVQNPVPGITSLTPNYISGTNPRSITVNGNNFIPGSQVRLNNSNRATTYLDSRRLIVQIPASDLDEQKQFSVTVYNPGPGGGYSQSAPLSVSGPLNAPASNSNSNSYQNNYNEATNPDANEMNGFGDLTASAIIGAGDSFLPSGLVGWIIVAMLVLVIVILVRRIYGAEARYHATPLKHS